MGIEEDTLKEIDKIMFDFLWSRRKPKVSKQVIQQQYEKGGLKAPNISNRVISWQIMWLQRATKHPSRKWVVILDTILNSILFKDLLKSSSNRNPVLSKLPKFYANIINNWQKLTKDPEINAKYVKSQLIWLNKDITINNEPFFWTKWYNAGIVSINDLLNENNNFLSHTELSSKYNIKCNFIESLQIRQSIPFAWRQTLRVQAMEEQNKCLSLSNITSKQVYWTLMEKMKQTKPSCINKWMAELNIDSENDNDDLDKVWEQTFLMPFKTCDEPLLQSFQFRVLHRILPCNHWLNSLKVTNSPICTFCDDDDTIIHYLAHCHTVVNFWNDFALWWTSFATDIIINEITVIFGFEVTDNESKMLNYAVILAKHYIYNSKRNQCIPCFRNYLAQLTERLHLKQMYYSQNGMLDKFNRKWTLLYNNVNRN